MTPEAFIGKAIIEMVNDNVSVHFNRRKYNSRYSYNFFTSGDNGAHKKPEKAELVINYFCEDFSHWFPVFVHEYCHYLEWKDDPEYDILISRGCEKFGKFLNGDIKTINKSSIRQIQQMEIDCDARAIKLINKHKFPIDLEKYIKEENLYIYCYGYMAKYKKFFIPFEAELLDMMPSELIDVEYCNTPNKELEQLYLKHLYPPK